MSIVALGLNLLLAALLLAALAMGFRLNSRLKALKDSHEGFARAVAELDAAAARGDIDFAADVERVTHKLGSLLSGAREPRPRRAPEPVLRREPAPTRQRPAFEEELFAEPGEVEPRRAEAPRVESPPLQAQDEPRRRPLRSVMGGRR